MNDTEIAEMRDQIKKEADIDPMDGGVVIPDGGDGIKRMPIGDEEEEGETDE